MFKDAIETGGLAVVTGGASGVGLAAAKAFARQGLSVVLVDTNADALEDAARAVEAHTQGSAKVITAKTDVSDAASMAHLAQTAQDLGPVAVLMNNAGIAVPTESWGKSENWRRLIDVNLFGVVNGVHAFVPLMIEANRPAAIINTGSKQGITTPPGNPGYNVSKAGVKVLTEMLAHDLRAADAPISAHLFVPGFTYTGMIASFLPDKPPAAWTSEQAVSYLFERLERDDFYILCPDNEVSEEIDQRRVAWAAQDVVENRPALSRWHPDYADAFKRFEGG
ncbi:SDR family NAD(P)-dependent oxidoreductase [uncultured Tateyamaria sp.]|uniref:SDR family NAD(P)-dependent oxidoreductase n=1 Tax=uncultured Tateyamaria sp. TaxID=455651 RepID=UPI002629AFD5|nr:SDR family NAD(P)-dependent oxidoreductase [uncultured Tateyamaria sp.]